MKKIYFIGFVCLFVDVLFSQEFLKDTEKCSTIEYVIKHDNKFKLADYTYTLYFDSRHSYYLEKDLIEYFKTEKDEVKRNLTEEEIIKLTSQPSGKIESKIYRKDTSRNFYYNDLSKEIYIQDVEPWGKFFYRDKVDMKWKIKDEHKKIGDYNCQKAECFFRGKRHIAWFSTELPYPYGPWKFRGLPGIILETYTVGYAKISITSIHINTSDENCNFEPKLLYLNKREIIPSYKKHLVTNFGEDTQRKRDNIIKHFPKWLAFFAVYSYQVNNFEKFNESFFEDYEGE